MSFLTNYFSLIEGTGEQAVLCPFDHTTLSGIPYQESHASAHVNTDEQVFHCKACGRGFNDLTFIKEITGCTQKNAHKIQDAFQDSMSVAEWDNDLALTEHTKDVGYKLGFSNALMEELHIKTPAKGYPDSLMYPVFMYGQLCDYRIYTPNGNPKMISRKGSHTGLIIPYDIWTETPPDKTTLICAGEKDMSIARVNGFNAITITGGEKATPMFLNCFTDRAVAIVYDNDDTGIVGAYKLAKTLYPYTKKIKIITNFHLICKEEGEDIYDFFMKYYKTKEDLINLIRQTPYYIPEDESSEMLDEDDESKEKEKTIDLYTASKDYVNKMVYSNIQVIAVPDATFDCPTYINQLLPNNTVDMGNNWELNPRTCKDILYLIDNNLTEEKIRKNIKKEIFKTSNSDLKLQIAETITVYKAVITDLYETSSEALGDVVQPMEYTAYSLVGKLEAGQKYNIKYKLVPNPYRGQQLTMIIFEANQASDSVTNFEINDDTKAQLKVIQDLPGTIPERLDLLTEKIKGIIGYNGLNKLILTIDLAFHTVLKFDFGRAKNNRGYLDTLIIGESRTGKSSTADALRKLYGLGTFTSLAGNSATIAGLVGGSNKQANGGYQTRAGIIPQNHKGLIIFEEFGKSSRDILRELTDIRSSNEVRISRVSGTTQLPALVRMIALTNVKSISGEPIKSIASYPNGLSIVTELVPTAEDIARYDIILLLSEKANIAIDPTWEPETPLDLEVYKTRVRWVWTRTPTQIKIDKDLEKYIVEQCNILNEIYPCHIKLFGPEAWKKVTRLSIAIAGYLVSTDATYENIIVLKEHVDYAIEYMKELYDNQTFKLKEYVANEQKYTSVTDDSIASLQNIFNKYPGLIIQLENETSTSRIMLENTTGLDNAELKNGIKLLTASCFIRVMNNEIIPSEKFRLALTKISRNGHISRVGE